ncbi:ADP-ribosylation factor-like protein 6-interacting protein 6 isoform X2 [Electrophorus electricus]|uniref:ADP-ribosylation factor-like protein 6-interacting protein 6 isoform X2 n=1 Tax=Electrophorus electricus TaxID=8005 RepID=UPI0015CFA913|nr:ADP-ribosylation factor-like protein 6-interacting protein 6 isoform X2 [Electrophorus electricus]
MWRGRTTTWRGRKGPESFSGDECDASVAVTAESGASPEERSAPRRVWSGGHWPARILSVLCCLVIFLFIGVLASFLYIILKDLRAERTTTPDGTEVRLLGFWSMFILSSLAGLLCCSFSWTLTYFDSFEPGMFPPTPLSPARLSAEPARTPTQHGHHTPCLSCLCSRCIDVCRPLLLLCGSAIVEFVF